MEGYTKLFSSILASTVWREPDHVRLVWITMLAMANSHDVVEASIPGLADLARVPLDKCEDALQILESPDKYSRTKDHDGKRIKTVDGGWVILNRSKYKTKRSEDERREYKKLKQREYRQKEQAERGHEVDKSGQVWTKVDIVDPAKHSKAEDIYINENEGGCKGGECGHAVDRPLPKKQARKVYLADDAEWLKKLQEQYDPLGIDIYSEIPKAKAWLMSPKGKGRQFTRQYFVNWLSRKDATIQSNRTFCKVCGRSMDEHNNGKCPGYRR